MEGTSAGLLGKTTFQIRANFEVDINFEVGSGCSGLYLVMVFVPLRMEIMKHLWAAYSNVWPSSLWILFLISENFLCCSLSPISCIVYKKKSLYHPVSGPIMDLCNDRTAALRKLSCRNFLYLYGGCENPLNWKNITCHATTSDCKIHLSVVEEYSPVKSSSFHWGVGNIRREAKCSRKVTRKRKL